MFLLQRFKDKYILSYTSTKVLNIYILSIYYVGELQLLYVLRMVIQCLRIFTCTKVKWFIQFVRNYQNDKLCIVTKIVHSK